MRIHDGLTKPNVAIVPRPYKAIGPAVMLFAWAVSAAAIDANFAQCFAVAAGDCFVAAAPRNDTTPVIASAAKQSPACVPLD